MSGLSVMQFWKIRDPHTAVSEYQSCKIPETLSPDFMENNIQTMKSSAKNLQLSRPDTHTLIDRVGGIPAMNATHLLLQYSAVLSQHLVADRSKWIAWSSQLTTCMFCFIALRHHSSAGSPASMFSCFNSHAQNPIRDSLNKTHCPCSAMLSQKPSAALQDYDVVVSIKHHVSIINNIDLWHSVSTTCSIFCGPMSRCVIPSILLLWNSNHLYQHDHAARDCLSSVQPRLRQPLQRTQGPSFLPYHGHRKGYATRRPSHQVHRGCLPGSVPHSRMGGPGANPGNTYMNIYNFIIIIVSCTPTQVLNSNCDVDTHIRLNMLLCYRPWTRALFFVQHTATLLTLMSTMTWGSNVLVQSITQVGCSWTHSMTDTCTPW